MKNKKKNIKINYKKFFRSVLILAIFVFLLLKLPSIIFAPNNENKNSENLIDSKPDPITIHMSAFGDTMCHLTNIKNAYDASKMLEVIWKMRILQ